MLPPKRSISSPRRSRVRSTSAFTARVKRSAAPVAGGRRTAPSHGAPSARRLPAGAVAPAPSSGAGDALMQKRARRFSARTTAARRQGSAPHDTQKRGARRSRSHRGTVLAACRVINDRERASMESPSPTSQELILPRRRALLSCGSLVAVLRSPPAEGQRRGEDPKQVLEATSAATSGIQRQPRDHVHVRREGARPGRFEASLSGPSGGEEAAYRSRTHGRGQVERSAQTLRQRRPDPPGQAFVNFQGTDYELPQSRQAVATAFAQRREADASPEDKPLSPRSGSIPQTGSRSRTGTRRDGTETFTSKARRREGAGRRPEEVIEQVRRRRAVTQDR